MCSSGPRSRDVTVACTAELSESDSGVSWSDLDISLSGSDGGVAFTKCPVADVTSSDGEALVCDETCADSGMPEDVCGMMSDSGSAPNELGRDSSEGEPHMTRAAD